MAPETALRVLPLALRADLVEQLLHLLDQRGGLPGIGLFTALCIAAHLEMVLRMGRLNPLKKLALIRINGIFKRLNRVA